jgi:hypothetical protein
MNLINSQLLYCVSGHNENLGYEAEMLPSQCKRNVTYRFWINKVLNLWSLKYICIIFQTSICNSQRTRFVSVIENIWYPSWEWYETHNAPCAQKRKVFCLHMWRCELQLCYKRLEWNSKCILKKVILCDMWVHQKLQTIQLLFHM